MDEPGLRRRSSCADRRPNIVVLVGGEETAGRCGLVETVERRGAHPPRHLHLREDETLYVIEGSLSVWVAGEWVEAPAGTALFLPRGVEHALVPETEEARVLSFFAPAGFEEFYGEMAGVGPPDVERLVTTAARYGCEIAGPTPERPRVQGGLRVDRPFVDGAFSDRQGRKADGSFASSPSSPAKQASESKRGKHSQSTEPSVPTRAAVCRSPTIA